MKLKGKTQSQVDLEKKEKLLQQDQIDSQKYLDSTDWYIIRKLEREIEIPNDVKNKRAQAIKKINEFKK